MADRWNTRSGRSGPHIRAQPDRKGILARLVGLFGVKPEFTVANDSPVYDLCARYACPDLWTSYRAYRLNPQSDTWRRLREHHVPWHRGRSLHALMQIALPQLRATPDPASVERVLLNVNATFPAGARSAQSLRLARRHS